MRGLFAEPSLTMADRPRLFPVPCSLFPTLCCLWPIPSSLFPIPGHAGPPSAGPSQDGFTVGQARTDFRPTIRAPALGHLKFSPSRAHAFRPAGLLGSIGNPAQHLLFVFLQCKMACNSTGG